MTEEKFIVNESFSEKSYSLVNRNPTTQADGLYVDCRLYKRHDTLMTGVIFCCTTRGHTTFMNPSSGKMDNGSFYLQQGEVKSHPLSKRQTEEIVKQQEDFFSC